MIKRIFNKNKASNNNNNNANGATSSAAVAAVSQVGTTAAYPSTSSTPASSAFPASSSNTTNTTANNSPFTNNSDQSILNRLKIQFENVVSLKHNNNNNSNNNHNNNNNNNNNNNTTKEQLTNSSDTATNCTNSSVSLSSSNANPILTASSQPATPLCTSTQTSLESSSFSSPNNSSSSANTIDSSLIDDNQKTMTNSDGLVLLEQYNQQINIANRLNDLYNKQQQEDELQSHAADCNSSGSLDEINSVLFKLPETTSQYHSSSDNTPPCSHTNRIILTTDMGNDYVLSRRQSISMATTIEYPLRSRILRHLSSSNAIQQHNSSGSASNTPLQVSNGMSCSSSSCSLFNKSSSSLYSSTACLCFNNPSIAASTSNLKIKSLNAAGSSANCGQMRSNLLSVDNENSRRQSWGSYTNINQTGGKLMSNQLRSHHPKCPHLLQNSNQNSSVNSANNKNKKQYLHPNTAAVPTTMLLQSSSSTSSTSSLLSASSHFKLKQLTTPTITNTTTTAATSTILSKPLLTPTTGHRTAYRINSINNLHQFNKTSSTNVKKDVSDSPVQPSSSNLLRLKSDKLGSSAPNLFATNSMVNTFIFIKFSFLCFFVCVANIKLKRQQ